MFYTWTESYVIVFAGQSILSRCTCGLALVWKEELVFASLMEPWMLNFMLTFWTEPCSHSSATFSKMNPADLCKITTLSIRPSLLRNTLNLLVWTSGKPFPSRLIARRMIKPHSKQELVDGIMQFWGTADIPKCKRYIRHLRKVIPRVIELNGEMLQVSEALLHFSSFMWIYDVKPNRL